MIIISNPKKPLSPAKEVSKWEWFCMKIAPYLIVIFIIILLLLISIAIVKYGAQITGTEANQYYYGGWRQ